MAAKRRVGVVGYGHLGKFLTEAILNHPELELAFVWNRTRSVFINDDLDSNVILDDLKDCGTKNPDIIVEVSHPVVVKQVNYLQAI
jgi:aspartate dehydrogenase